MTNAGGVLDAEYRELVRSLHAEAVRAVVATQTWLTTAQDGLAHLAGVEMSGLTPGDDDVRAAQHAVAQWDSEIQPELSALIVGHPDPDVSDAAQFLVSRVWASLFVLRQALSGSELRGPGHAELTRRVSSPGASAEALVRLSRVVRLAPFRIYRPQPTTDRTLETDPDLHPTFSVWFDHFERREHDFSEGLASAMSAAAKAGR